MIISLRLVIFLPVVVADSLHECWISANEKNEFCDTGCCVINTFEGVCCEDSNSSSNSDSKNYGWAIGVGIVGFIIVVMTIVTVVMWCFTQTKKHRRVIAPSNATQVYTTGTVVYSPYYGRQYQYGQPSLYPSQTRTPYLPPISANPSVGHPGTSRASASIQGGSRLPEKQSLDEPEGIQAPPPASYALPSNHRIV